MVVFAGARDAAQHPLRRRRRTARRTREAGLPEVLFSLFFLLFLFIFKMPRGIRNTLIEHEVVLVVAPGVVAAEFALARGGDIQFDPGGGAVHQPVGGGVGAGAVAGAVDFCSAMGAAALAGAT